jgi:hypothetical protein
MSLTLKLARRAARFRAIIVASVLLGASACDGDRLGPVDTDGVPTATLDEQSYSTTETLADPQTGPSTEELSATVSFAGGIPIGTFAQPNSAFGPLYNGAMRTLKPWELLVNLAAIRARGGRVVLMFAGNDRHYRDGSGHFDFNKWKARIDRFRRINFSSYINDGTIIGHYLLDEPNDPTNWNGRAVPASTVEEMAKYSKQIWPNLTTIVRTESTYLAKWSGTYRYLDAAWAQYLHRRGDVDGFLSRNVADAKRKGLALVVGLNILKGGPNRTKMTASQVQSWGSALLSSSYPCAFISWQYDASYLSSSSIKEAMSVLRSKAQNRSSKSCRAS